MRRKPHFPLLCGPEAGIRGKVSRIWTKTRDAPRRRIEPVPGPLIHPRVADLSVQVKRNHRTIPKDSCRTARRSSSEASRRSCLVLFFVVVSFKSASVMRPLGMATEQILFWVKCESGFSAFPTSGPVPGRSPRQCQDPHQGAVRGGITRTHGSAAIAVEYAVFPLAESA